MTTAARTHRTAIRCGARLANLALPAFTGLLFLFLFAPIAVMIVFSFNDPGGRQNITWQGFTLRNYVDLWGRSEITDAMTDQPRGRGHLDGRRDHLRHDDRPGADPLPVPRPWLMNLLIFIPMTAPEIILGASLLTLWVSLGVERGFLTILAAHVMFNISFVVVTVRARLAGMNRSLEEAGMDLYADSWTTFWKVTFPLIFPGILSAALLAFALSIDDYVITVFSAGRDGDLPALGLRRQPARASRPRSTCWARSSSWSRLLFIARPALEPAQRRTLGRAAAPVTLMR